MRDEGVIGQTLDDKYKIESQLGKGGMGTVYLATHIGTERPVAVKVIASEFMKREEFVERFRREARAAGRLRHPNVVDVTDFGFSATKNGDVAYLVMEYLDGCTLGEILKEEKNLPLSWTVDILEQVCSAVHEAHEQGIIHRDLKPDNIWLEPNQRGGYTVKVLDFGIAKLEETQLSIPERAGFAAVSSNAETKIYGANDTIAESLQTGTIADRKNFTVAGEAATVALSDDSYDFGTEGGTLIQGKNESHTEPQEIDADQTSSVVSAENDETKLIPDNDAVVGSKISGGSSLRSFASTSSTSELTRVGAVLGTPLYMSPEQCRGEKLTAHSDVYSLGVITYQMLSGNTPFEGDYSEVMRAHKELEPPVLEAKKVSRKVKKVINASLSKSTDERPQTAEAFASELRASSEGLGTLLRRALVIYSERITKFLQIAFLLAIPSFALTVLNITLRFMIAVEFLPDSVAFKIVGGVSSFVLFFLNIFYAALVVGMTTWVVAQVLATPLRPISIRTTFRQVGKRWKSLAGTVTLSTFLSIVSWIAGAIAGSIISLIISGPIYYFTGNAVWIVGFALGFAILGMIMLGLGTSSCFMLIAPSIMMEGVSGRAAFRRSLELVRRSFRTVLATAVIIYVVPVTLAMLIALSLNGMMNTFDPPKNSDKPIVVEQENVKTDPNVNVTVGGSTVQIKSDESEAGNENSMGKNLRDSIQKGLYELLWSPLSFFFISFTSVITALLYFKTRQAGGESMRDLLFRFEDDECPQTNWQMRVRERLLQSGRTTTGKKIIT